MENLADSSKFRNSNQIENLLKKNFLGSLGKRGKIIPNQPALLELSLEVKDFREQGPIIIGKCMDAECARFKRNMQKASFQGIEQQVSKKEIEQALRFTGILRTIMRPKNLVARVCVVAFYVVNKF